MAHAEYEVDDGLRTVAEVRPRLAELGLRQGTRWSSRRGLTGPRGASRAPRWRRRCAREAGDCRWQAAGYRGRLPRAQGRLRRRARRPSARRARLGAGRRDACLRHLRGRGSHATAVHGLRRRAAGLRGRRHARLAERARGGMGRAAAFRPARVRRVVVQAHVQSALRPARGGAPGAVAGLWLSADRQAERLERQRGRTARARRGRAGRRHEPSSKARRSRSSGRGVRAGSVAVTRGDRVVRRGAALLGTELEFDRLLRLQARARSRRAGRMPTGYWRASTRSARSSPWGWGSTASWTSR